MVITEVSPQAGTASPAAKLAMLVSCSQKLSQDARAVLFALPSPFTPKCSAYDCVALGAVRSDPYELRLYLRYS